MKWVSDLVERALAPVRTRIVNMLARSIITLVADGTTLQKLQLGVLAGEDSEDAERVQQYGFSSVPQVGAEAVVLFPGGDRSHPLVIAVDDRRWRPTGRPGGEVALYTDEQDTIRFMRGHIILIQTQPGGELIQGNVVINSPKVEIGNELGSLSPVPTNGVATGITKDSWGVPLVAGGVSDTVFAQSP